MKRIMKVFIVFVFLFDPITTLLAFGAKKAFKSSKPPSAEEIAAQGKAKQDAAAKKGIQDSLDNKAARKKLVNPTGGLGLSGPANVQRRQLSGV